MESSAFTNSRIVSTEARRIASSSFVEQFPRRIHTTFGGALRRKLICMKSESLETMVNPPASANSQRPLSVPRSRPTSDTCFDSGYRAAKVLASRGGRFWSKRSLTRRPRWTLTHEELPLSIRCEGKDSLNVVPFQVGEFLKDLLLRHARSQVL